MASKVTSIEIKATDPNDTKITTTISYVNEEATNANLISFARKLNALTQNTYESTNKITKEVLI